MDSTIREKHTVRILFVGIIIAIVAIILLTNDKEPVEEEVASDTPPETQEEVFEPGSAVLGFYPSSGELLPVKSLNVFTSPNFHAILLAMSL